MTQLLTDTHAHLYYAAKFAPDVPTALDRALAAGVDRIYLPNVDLESIGPMLALADRHPRYTTGTLAPVKRRG
jgi:TatD DNase family protein